jgi:DNA-binding MarR family transcriptional regulator
MSAWWATGAASPERLLDSLLATLGYSGLSPTEVRLLLWLAPREATPSELSEALGQPSGAIERATRRLDMRGLIRRRFERGSHSRFIFSITSAGLLYLDPLVQCVAGTRTEIEDIPGREDTAHVG